jgi:methylphosphotriester-DNA--protein-cysteine methyltransferase
VQKLTNEEMLKARLRRDTDYDGRFYVGVLTMKTYCLPSCKAKLALEKNMEFFFTREEAINEGFRGCQRCKAEMYPEVRPAWLDNIVDYMKDEISNKIDERKLEQITNVDITTIRRQFKIFYNTSLMAYHRKLRLIHAKKMIEKGVEYKRILARSGFRSDSGFRAAFIKEFGHPPGEFKNERN